MIRSVKKITFLLAIFLLILPLVVFRISSSNKISEIDKVLMSNEYSYLPKEAKNYIKELYEESGRIILTEKNKKKNEPYLNPAYVVYLEYSEEEKKELGEIPVSLIVDYAPTDTVKANLPSSYNLRSVNGKNFVSPIRNQGELGICWTFSSASSVESYLLMKSNTSYNSSSRLISERQIDYATAINGIEDYQSEYVSFVDRALGDGGNFYVSTIAMASGISLVDYNNCKAYDDTDLEKMELADILSYDKSLYEVNSTINMPNIGLRASTSQLTSAEQETRNNYLNTIKQNIMNNGVAYVATYMDSSCQYKDNNLNNTVIDVYNCNYSGGHAMGIIGWDDNLQYTYCNDNNKHTNNTNNCNNIVSGKGVWILKNSWGSIQQYPYLTYDSLESSIHFITDLSDNDGNSWKNNYLLGAGEMAYQSKSYTLTDTKVRNDETIKKIKFISYTENTTFTVKVKKKDGSYETVSKSVTLPGLVTVDIPNSVAVNNSTQITISSNGYFIDKVMIFTDNIDTTPFIDLDKYNNISVNEDEKRFYSDTKAIPSGSVITYKFYNSSNVEVSNEFTVTNNIVAENNINTLIHFENVDHGLYRVDALYNNSVIGTFNINVIRMEGQGTEEHPFIIKNPVQLSLIRNNPSAYYELGNDIDLTSATRIGGDLSQPSDVCPDVFGWQAINNFSGSLDGKGYTIKGLYQNNYIYCVKDDGYQWWNLNDEGNGLFGYVRGNVTIKNLILEDFDITCQGGNCGALLSEYIANGDEEGEPNNSDTTSYTANFQNIAIKKSRIKGEGDSLLYGGGLLGYLESSYGTININGIYLDIMRNLSNFNSDGYLINSIKANQTNISNIHMVGDLVGKYEDGSGNALMIGTLYANQPVTIKNVLSTVTTKNVMGGLLGNVVGNNLTIDSVNILKNENKPLCPDNKCSSATNVKVFDKDTQLSEFTKSSNYSTWSNFNNSWTIQSVNGVARVPILKFMTFDYTEFDNIILNQQLNNKVSVFDYLSPQIDAARNISYKSNGESIVTIDNDGAFVPLKSGQTTIHIESLYDGYIKDVPITVNYVPHYVIHFDANGGTGEMKDIEVAEGRSFTLPDNIFTKSDYDFNTWNTEVDGKGTSYANGGQIPGHNDKEVVTLYAQWLGQEHTVTFNPNGGTVSPTSKKIRTGEKYGDLPVPKKANSGFNGWSCEGFTISADDTLSCYDLVADWTDNAYTIIYDSNGGRFKDDYSDLGSLYVLSDSSFSDIGLNSLATNTSGNPFERSGFIFKEWNTKADGTGSHYQIGEDVSLNDVNDSELRLYAIWQGTQYTIHFNANGGTGTMNDYNYGFDAVGVLPENTFTRSNYSFKKWCTNSNGTGICLNNQETITNLFSDGEIEITLYAIWESVRYTIHFNANGGTGTMSDYSFSANATGVLPMNTFTRNGYVFKKWCTNANGTGTCLNNQASVTNLFSNGETEKTLYAIWENTITYIINNYTVDENNRYIDKIPVNTDVNTFKGKITLGAGYSVVVDTKTVNNKQVLYTGGKTKIMNGSNVYREFTNIVRGDINGDGKISSLDYVKVKNHIMGSSVLIDDVYKKAADANDDNKISALDYVKIKNYIMNGG